MATSFPVFLGKHNKNAREFLDTLEMAHLISRRDDEGIKLRAFPLVLKEEARAWYDAAPTNLKVNWEALTQAFSVRFGNRDTPNEMWQLLLQHLSLSAFAEYESRFQELWTRWERSLGEGQAAPALFKKERFVAGLLGSFT